MRDSVDPPEIPPAANSFEPPRPSSRGDRLRATAARAAGELRRHPFAYGAMALALLVVVLGVWATWGLPIGRALDPKPTPTLVLVTADGKPFARRGSYMEAPVDIADLPRHVPMAFVAIEDRRFFEHAGLDVRAIGRAAVVNLKAGGVREGGSTITQQLAKNAFLSDERTFHRKAQEALIALYLEARLSKAEILSRYLSKVYFGDGVFGLGAAAKHYFNKTPDKLSIGEAAMLAGVVKAPSRLAPTEDIKAARARQAVVLRRMLSLDLITPAQAKKAARVKVRQGRANLPVGSYFADWVSPQAKSLFDRAYGEVVVRTTLDSRLQSRAEQVVRRIMTAQGPRLNASQAALVAMRPDGSIVAMVGGSDYRKSQFNRAVQAERQPGSAFKLFVYAAAMRRGATPDSTVIDAPITIGDWTPQNHEEKYLGRPITYREAFARSSNVAAARVAQAVGIGPIQRTAREFGITGDLPNDATVALGTGQVTLLELTSAYAAVRAGRTPVHPHGLSEYEPDTSPIRPEEQGKLLDLLHAVVATGTGRTAGGAGVDAFGKTGTSQDYRDAWFIGFAGDLIVGVWVGNDDNAPMKRVTGGMLPAQIWRDFVAYAVSARKVGAGPERAAGEYGRGIEVLPPGWADTVQGEVIDGQPAPTIEGEPLPPPPLNPPPFEPPRRGDSRDERFPPRYDPRDEPPPRYGPPPRLEPPPPRYEEPPYGSDEPPGEPIDEGDGFGPGAG